MPFGKEAAMPISPEAKFALSKCDQYLSQVPSVPLQEHKANLLQQTQILLLRAILVEIAEMRQEKSAD